MRPLARVLVDEAHRQAWSTRPEIAAAMSPANPADSSYAQAAATLVAAGFSVEAHCEGLIDDGVLADVDVLVLPHCSLDEWEATTQVGSPIYTPAEMDAIQAFVRRGGGLVILAETEQPKYGNSLGDIAALFGVQVVNCTAQDPVHRFNDVSTWVLMTPERRTDVDVFAEVAEACLYRAGALDVSACDGAFVLARTHATASPALAPVVVGVNEGMGRVVVVADSDFVGDDSIDDLDHRQLWLNLVTWVTAIQARGSARDSEMSLVEQPVWGRLVAAVEQLRVMQIKDGSIPARHDEARALVRDIVAALSELEALVPHQVAYLEAAQRDFTAWSDDFGTPDFLDSLSEFHPELARRDGIEHVAVFPMYTQNGNPDRNVEAVAVRTVWPEWIAALEASTYDNAAFVPIEFLGFTSGYDTHSAVLFPETVATREVMKFTWGGIFCDREAARFRRVSRAAADRLRLALPPDAEMLLSNQTLAQETFVLWDLVHDRTHSHGDLPFDPFMIKQRMPYWMYALEELRCDLSTYRETKALEASGIVLARHVRLAILCDRLFRFPTTGDRVRNYDGLAGQIVFAWLHKHGVLRWTDNTLHIDWARCQESMDELCEQVETLYREGIDRSRMGYWLAAHEFISALVPPHPASIWAQGAMSLPTETKAAVDAVLPDEFPLNVFYESLRTALAPAIESARGITGQAA